MKKVHVYYQSESRGPIEALLRSRSAFQSYGYELSFSLGFPSSKEKPDLILIQQILVKKETLEGEVPIILLERADAAISWARVQTQHPNVKKVIKGGVLRPPELNNICTGRYHTTLLPNATILPTKVRLSPEHWEKLVPGATYAAYDLMESWINVKIDWNKQRTYDLNFLGTTDYGNRGEISQHRKTAVEVIKNIKGNHLVGRGGISRQGYNEKLLDSKIVVSPWGFGEVTYRDYEAMYAGCVIIKPNTDFVQTWPDIFKSHIHYIPCKPDWSDLKEKVNWTQNNWWNLTDLRRKNRDILLEHWVPERIAAHYSEILQGVV